MGEQQGDDATCTHSLRSCKLWPKMFKMHVASKVVRPKDWPLKRYTWNAVQTPEVCPDWPNVGGDCGNRMSQSLTSVATWHATRAALCGPDEESSIGHNARSLYIRSESSRRYDFQHYAPYRSFVPAGPASIMLVCIDLYQDLTRPQIHCLSPYETHATEGPSKRSP